MYICLKGFGFHEALFIAYSLVVFILLFCHFTLQYPYAVHERIIAYFLFEDHINISKKMKSRLKKISRLFHGEKRRVI